MNFWNSHHTKHLLSVDLFECIFLWEECWEKKKFQRKNFIQKLQYSMDFQINLMKLSVLNHVDGNERRESDTIWKWRWLFALEFSILILVTLARQFWNPCGENHTSFDQMTQISIWFLRWLEMKACITKAQKRRHKWQIYQGFHNNLSQTNRNVHEFVANWNWFFNIPIDKANRTMLSLIVATR